MSEQIHDRVALRKSKEQDSPVNDEDNGIERISISKLKPFRGNNAKGTWYMSWQQVILVDRPEQDHQSQMISALDELLQIYGAYECPVYRQVANQCKGNKYVFKCQGTVCRFKMEFFCSCEIDFDYTKIIEVLEGQRAYVFNISINQNEHDCTLQNAEEEMIDEQDKDPPLNHSKQRLNFIANKNFVIESLLNPKKNQEIGESFLLQAQIQGEIMPDVANLQRHFMWKHSPKTVNDLIEYFLELFKKWQKYDQKDVNDYLYDKKEIKIYLARQCYWISGQAGPNKSVDFELLSLGEVEIFVKNFSEELKMDDATYSLKISTYNEVLMQRLYDQCLKQFIQAAKTIPQDLHYLWISNSLPLRQTIVEKVPTSESYALKTDDHGNVYKDHDREVYKDKFKDFYERVSKSSALIIRDKLYNNSGTSNTKQIVELMNERIKEEIIQTKQAILDDKESIKQLNESLKEREANLVNLQKRRKTGKEDIKFCQILKEAHQNQMDEILKAGHSQLMNGLRQDAEEQGEESLKRYNKVVEALLPNHMCKTADEILLENIDSEDYDRCKYMKLISSQHIKKSKAEQKAQKKANDQSILLQEEGQSLVKPDQFSQMTSSSTVKFPKKLKEPLQIRDDTKLNLEQNNQLSQDEEF